MAAGAALGRFHFPVIYERLRLFHTGFALVDEAFRIEVKDVFRITQSGFGIAVTFQTESHAERLHVRDDIHLVDLAVALDARNATVHVDGVIKIGVVRRFVDPDPRNGLAGGGTLPDRREERTRRLDLVMAVHARLRRGHIRMGGLIHIRVAVTTIEADLLHVFRVTERDWLERSVADARVLRRHVISHSCGRDAYEHPEVNDDLERKLVRRLWKKFRHGGGSSSGRGAV